MGPLFRHVCAVAVIVVVTLIVTMATFVYVYGRRWKYISGRFGTLCFPREKVSEAYDSLKTGDLILYTSALHPSTNVFTDVPFSHGGIVVVDGGSAKVSESQSGFEIMPGAHMLPGADVVPLLARLKFYAGSFYLARRLQPLSDQAASAVEDAAYRLRGYPYPAGGDLARAMFGLSTRTRHCFQHIVYVMRLAGAWPTTGEASGWLESCRDVCRVANGAGKVYAPPVQLIYDVDVNLNEYNYNDVLEVPLGREVSDQAGPVSRRSE